MCKVGGPRCPMDHKRRSEVNARRRTRDRATRAYRSGLVAALEDQGKDELARVARKAPSGDLAVMAAATGNTAVGDGLDYVPGMKRANEKVSTDVVKALGDAGVSVDAGNRGDMLAEVAEEKPGTEEKPSPSVYDNIDSPEKARAAADAMYAELGSLDREDFEAMDRDELEAMYNKYDAIDDEIRAQGNISADETSSNAFINLHDVYNGLDEDGLPIEDDDEDLAEYGLSEPEPAQGVFDVNDIAATPITRDNLDALNDQVQHISEEVGTSQDLKALSDDEFYQLYERHHDTLGAFADHAETYSGREIPGVARVAGDARAAWTELSNAATSRGVYPEVTNDNRDELHGKARELLAGVDGERIAAMSDDELRVLRENTTPRLTSMRDRLHADRGYRDSLDLGDDADDAVRAVQKEFLDRKNTRRVFGPASMGVTTVATREQAETVTRRAEKMATMLPPESSSDRDLVDVARNIAGVQPKVHKRGTRATADDFDAVYESYAAEAERRAEQAEKRLATHKFVPSGTGDDEFNTAICPKHLAGKAKVGRDGTVTFADDATALDKLEITSNMREYSRYVDNPKKWGRAEFERTSEFWDGDLMAPYGDATAYVDTDPHGDPRVMAEATLSQGRSRALRTEVDGRKQADEISRAIAYKMEQEFPGHPANKAARVIVHRDPVGGDSYEVLVPGDLQKMGVDPRDYYRELTNVVGEAGGRD